MGLSWVLKPNQPLDDVTQLCLHGRHTLRSAGFYVVRFYLSLGIFLKHVGFHCLLSQYE